MRQGLHWLVAFVLLVTACTPDTRLSSEPPSAAAPSEPAAEPLVISAPVVVEAPVSGPAVAEIEPATDPQDVQGLIDTAVSAAATVVARTEQPTSPEARQRAAAVAASAREIINPAETCETAGPAISLVPVDPSESERESRRRAWRTPLPSTRLWNPDGPWRVGLQAGHWLNEEKPDELSRLQHGASGGGRQEWEVNLDIAQRTKALLEEMGIVVDLLPTTVPMRYRAHAFISIHADGDPSGQISGFKIARPGFSSVPTFDDRLVEALYTSYEPATGLRRDDANITNRMRFYYAFNSRRYCHAVAPGVPQAIVETGFLTNASDRELLIGRPDAAARGIANGVIQFLRALP